MVLGVIGLGLIGGSLAIALKGKNEFAEVVGYDQSDIHCDKAMELGLVDQTLSREDLVAKSDVIFIAIPVHYIEAQLPQILNDIKPNQVIIDFGSTKSAICAAVKAHKNRSQYVAAHPMAGTENTGPTAAIEGLFKGKVNIICDDFLSSDHALTMAKAIFQSLEMQTMYMSSEDHDRHIAYVSHLSHISSFMLGLTVLDIEKDEKNIFNMAGSGFQSTVRLAMSSPEMWAPIFDKNADNITEALDTYIQYLQKFRSMMNSNDQNGMKEDMKRANEIRKVLKM